MLYNFGDLVEGNLLGKMGEQERECFYLNGCAPNFNDVQVCRIDTAMTATIVQKCGREFVEVNNSQGDLISRLEYLNGTYKRLNIQFVLGDDSCPDF